MQVVAERKNLELRALKFVRCTGCDFLHLTEEEVVMAERLVRRMRAALTNRKGTHRGPVK